MVPVKPIHKLPGTRYLTQARDCNVPCVCRWDGGRVLYPCWGFAEWRRADMDSLVEGGTSAFITPVPPIQPCTPYRHPV
jgi:hypothetical protein